MADETVVVNIGFGTVNQMSKKTIDKIMER